MLFIRGFFLAVACLCVGAVQAADSDPWSVAVDFGDTTLAGDSGTEFGLPYRFGDSAQGWRLAIARDIWGPLSVEIAHDDLGTLSNQWIQVNWNAPLPVDLSQCPGINCTVTGGTSSFAATSDSLALTARFEPAARFRLGAEVAYAHYDFDDYYETQDVARLGVSAGYALSDFWTVELRYTNASIERNGASDALTTTRLGVRYSF